MYRLDQTKEQIIRQWNEDFPVVQQKSRAFFMNKCMRKIKKLPNNKFPRFIVHKMKDTPNNNTYMTSLVLGNKKDFVEKHITMIYVIGIMKDDKGLYNGVVVRGDDVFIYSPHFFKRYAERMKKEEPILGEQWEQTLGKYIAHNFEGAQLIETIHQEKLAYERVCLEGVEMLRKGEQGAYIGTTFYDQRMLDERQASDLKDNEEYLMFMKYAMMDSKTFDTLEARMQGFYGEYGRGNFDLGTGLSIKLAKPNINN